MVHSLAVMKEIPKSDIYICLDTFTYNLKTNPFKLIKQEEMYQKLMESPEVGWSLEQLDSVSLALPSTGSASSEGWTPFIIVG